MRIVIDLQGSQTGSRYRGIGRYSLAFTKSIIKNRNGHDIFIVLSGLLFDSLEYIQKELQNLIPNENIFIWNSTGPVMESQEGNETRRQNAAIIREKLILELRPDIIHICSLFEGYLDNAVTDIGFLNRNIPVSVSVYDLIPLLNPKQYLEIDLKFKKYYLNKIEELKKSSVLLAISEFTNNEICNNLKYPKNQVVSVSTAVDEKFKKIKINIKYKKNICKKFNILRPFILYTGGADERKNLPRLIEAFAMLPITLRKKYQLVFVGDMSKNEIDLFFNIANLKLLDRDELLILNYVNDDDLVMLYNMCDLYVFPSWHEGFGLPALEAMACGAPVIASNNSSLNEVINFNVALFDPFNVNSISSKIEEVLCNKKLKKHLSEHGIMQAQKFSWDKIAINSLKKWQNIVGATNQVFWDGQVNIKKISLLNSYVKRILVLKLDHMGDLILAIPALNHLRLQNPSAQIDIVLGSWNVELAKQLNIFTTIFILDYYNEKSSLSPFIIPDAINNLVDTMIEYDVAIDLRRHPDTRFILLNIPSKYKVGYLTNDNLTNSFIDFHLENDNDLQFNTSHINMKSMSVQLLDLIKILPTNKSDQLSKLHSPQKSKLEDIKIAIFPFSGTEIKDWEIDSYIELLKQLLRYEKIKEIGIFQKNKDKVFDNLKDKYLNLKIYKDLSYENLKINLLEYDIAIAGNSGGIHISSWLGLKTIGIYGGHSPINEWVPAFGSAYIISSPIICSPCHFVNKIDCISDFKCLKRISPRHVLKAIDLAISDNLN